MARSLAERLAALQNSVRRHDGVQSTSSDTNDNRLSIQNSGVGKDELCQCVTSDDRHSNTHSHLNDLEFETPTPGSLSLESLGFARMDAGFGSVNVRTLRYDILTYHGSIRYADMLTCDVAALHQLSKSPFQLEQLRFYDTETTGLGTGAGTFPFLHAVGELTEDEFLIHQYFISDFSEEYAVLQTMIQRHFQCDFTVVTFNGKSFDWPLLYTRTVMYRIHLDTPCAHLDLLFPSRRLWKRRLQNVTLSNVELGILGLERKDDLPGKEAPNRYFQYCDTRDALLIEPVLAHNASDVCTLASLLVHVARVMSGEQEVHSAAELIALGRWYDEWQMNELADRCFARAASAEDADWKSLWLHAMYLKKQGRLAEAVMVWEQMAHRYKWTVPPLVELAKHAEHTEKKLHEAEKWVELAIERVIETRFLTLQRRTAAASGSKLTTPTDVLERQHTERTLQLLEHRLRRIRRKQSAQKRVK